jgi:hypothetical protein
MLIILANFLINEVGETFSAVKTLGNTFLNREKAKFNQIKCVACSDDRNDFQFTKNKFEYCLCQNCGTLYQNPRPELLYFEEFYKNSESSSYWENVFFPSVLESRVEKIFKPRVRSVEKLLKKRILLKLIGKIS